MLKDKLNKVHWIISTQFGLNLRAFLRSLRGIPQYVSDWLAFRKAYQGTMTFVPCLHDRYEEGGATKSEYFWQDLLVARWIFEASPARHVDIGSRVDGFVAHLASFREVEVFDVRPISSKIPGVVFQQADLMDVGGAPALAGGDGYCDSLSCLHAIEHFGLGRYGDPVDPQGHVRGLTNMAALVKSGGVFYLSTPIGAARVEFNANRVFDPREIVQIAQSNGLSLKKLVVVASDGTVSDTRDITAERLQDLASHQYNLGIFVFEKTAGRPELRA